MERPWVGLLALGLWVGAQGVWLGEGYRLEFLGESRFVPGLWVAGLGFLAVNMWVLGVVVEDVGRIGEARRESGKVDGSRGEERKEKSTAGDQGREVKT